MARAPAASAVRPEGASAVAEVGLNQTAVHRAETSAIIEKVRDVVGL